MRSARRYEDINCRQQQSNSERTTNRHTQSNRAKSHPGTQSMAIIYFQSGEPRQVLKSSVCNPITSHHV